MKLPRYCSASNMFVQTNVPSFDAISRKSKCSTINVLESRITVLLEFYMTLMYFTSQSYSLIYYVK